jgi:hypothetical protein
MRPDLVADTEVETVGLVPMVARVQMDGSTAQSSALSSDRFEQCQAVTTPPRRYARGEIVDVQNVAPREGADATKSGNGDRLGLIALERRQKAVTRRSLSVVDLLDEPFAVIGERGPQLGHCRMGQPRLAGL